MQLSKKSSVDQDLDVSTKYPSEDYRAWPIFMLSFIRLVSVSIFERAFQNYLYFVIGIRESTLGFISSAGAIAYIFAPILGHAITSKLGIRNSIIVSTLALPILTGAQMIYFEPWFLITCRVLNGLTMGLVWPNYLNLVSNWQKVNSVEKSNRLFRNFNFSWNFGLLFGLIIGFFMVFLTDDFFAMVISFYLTFLLIPISFFVKKEVDLPISNIEAKIHFEIVSSQDAKIDASEKKSKTPMIVYPILFSWLGILFITISKSSFIFSFPIFLKASDNPSYFTYIVQFGMQSAQLIGLISVNRMKISTRKLSALGGITFIILISLTITLFQYIWYTAIALAIVGLFLGFLHGVAMKIMLEYGTAKNSKRYSTINEILVGIGFGLTPIATGYIAEINIYIVFGFLVIFGIFIFVMLTYLSRNVTKEVSKAN